MIEQNVKKEFKMKLLFMFFIFVSSISSFFIAMDKSSIWRMALSSIPMIGIPILAVINILQYKKQK